MVESSPTSLETNCLSCQTPSETQSVTPGKYIYIYIGDRRKTLSVYYCWWLGSKYPRIRRRRVRIRCRDFLLCRQMWGETFFFFSRKPFLTLYSLLVKQTTRGTWINNYKSTNYFWKCATNIHGQFNRWYSVSCIATRNSFLIYPSINPIVVDACDSAEVVAASRSQK